jgi:hypothetical protein
LENSTRLRRGGQPLTSDTASDPNTDAENTSYSLSSHPVYDGSSDAHKMRLMYNRGSGLPEYVVGSKVDKSYRRNRALRRFSDRNAFQRTQEKNFLRKKLEKDEFDLQQKENCYRLAPAAAGRFL